MTTKACAHCGAPAHSQSRRIPGVTSLEDLLDCSVVVEASACEGGERAWVASVQLRHIGDCSAVARSPADAVAKLRRKVIARLRELTKSLRKDGDKARAWGPLPSILLEDLHRMVAKLGHVPARQATGLSPVTFARALRGDGVLAATREAIREACERGAA